MKKVFRVVLVLAVVTAAIGYFRNWYTITRVDEEQKTNIHVTIDRQRVRDDLNLAAEKAKNAGARIRSDGGNRPGAESGTADPEPR